MKKKVGFLEEAEGIKSSTRLNSLLLLFSFMGFNGFWIGSGNAIESNVLFFDMLLLVGVFAPKHLQKIVEMKLNNGKGNGNGEVDQ